MRDSMKQIKLILCIILFAVQNLMAQTPFIVKDIFTGPQSSNPFRLVKVGNELYFEANDGVTNFELWKTRGDSVFMVKDIFPGADLSAVREFTAKGDALYFSATDGVNGRELWKAEGDTTFMVKDINPTGNSIPQNLFVKGEDLYFSASDGISGRELWRLHKDSAFMIQDLYKGSNGSSPGNFTIVGDLLYFTANRDTNTDELWMTDGDSIYKVKGIPYKRFAVPQFLTALGNALYFSGESPSNGRELWKAIGDTAFIVKDLNKGTNSSNPSNFMVVDSTLYFTADDGIVGNELRKLQNDSIFLIKDINIGLSNASPYDLTKVGNTIYFIADEGVNQRKLWKTIGDTAYKVGVPSTLNQASIANRKVMGDKFFFGTSTPAVGSELWVAIEDTVLLVKDINPGTKNSNISQLEVVDNVLYFVADNGSLGAELWMVLGNQAFLVKDIYPGPQTSNPLNLVAVNNVLYFSAEDIAHGRELWKVNSPLHVTIDTIVCNGIWFNGSFLTQNGQYYDTLQTTNNRDSIIILNLEVFSVNRGISKNNMVLNALAEDATYQWINCNQSNAPIEGETSKIFIAKESGSYAVVISQNGCKDTSDCVEIEIVSIGSQEKLDEIRVYPNPVQTTLVVSIPNNLSEEHALNIYDAQGRCVLSKTFKESILEFHVDTFASGIYYLKLSNSNKTYFHKVIVE